MQDEIILRLTKLVSDLWNRLDKAENDKNSVTGQLHKALFELSSLKSQLRDAELSNDALDKALQAFTSGAST